MGRLPDHEGGGFGHQYRAWGQWLARCRDEASGPSSFHEAKANALAMARGACGNYFIENPIDHLNGLQARLLDYDWGGRNDGSSELICIKKLGRSRDVFMDLISQVA